MTFQEEAPTSVSTSADLDGRAYGLPPATFDPVIVHVGPGTPGGELLRRYWQPVAGSDAATDLPARVRVLSEDLILYRDKSGRPGLLYPRCRHRGATLFYGKVEEDGIRCPYHGWKYDAEGHCLDQPCEPNGGMHKDRVRQPWYPVMEKFGLIFTYMGPPDRQPQFPHFSFEDDLADDEEIVGRASKSRHTIRDDQESRALFGKTDFNWWNFYDNFMDQFHVAILHSRISGIHFTERMAIMPTVKWDYTPDGAGVRSVSHRDLGDGRIHQRVAETIMPNMIVSAGGVGDDLGPSQGITWAMPVDDTNFKTFGVYRQKKTESIEAGFFRDIGIFKPDYGPGKPFSQWTEEDHQRYPYDYECQKGQGDISLHSEETLTSTDRGIAMQRRLFRRQCELVSEGKDPVGISFDSPPYIRIMGGNAILDAETKELLEGSSALSEVPSGDG